MGVLTGISVFSTARPMNPLQLPNPHFIAHFFFRESRIAESIEELRVIRAWLGPVTLHDVRHLEGSAIYDSDDYSEAQRLGQALRRRRSSGLHYQSVRADGECFAVMRPNALSDAVHRRYLRFRFAEGEITEV